MTVRNLIRVLIADDQPVVRQGFELFLSADPGITVVGHAHNGVVAVEAATRLRPDVVLMDVRMPMRSGFWASRAILSEPDPPRVLIVTTFALDEYLFEALDLGASGFILKDSEPKELVAAVRNVARGGVAVSPRVAPRLVAEFARRKPGKGSAAVHAPDPGLSDRELQVLGLLVQGMSNDEIAQSLHLEASTVKSHVGNICRKVGVKNRVQVVVWAYETGVVHQLDAGRT
ncbi:response regulator [Tsukamurella sp. 1534]|uniref:response regulator n=1 Tax=Tsukamurella sp. 1534 TaxID=1151061 RepID=UPI0035297844